MAANSLQELFLEELRDSYDAEKRLTKALPKLAKAATASALQTALTSHLRETERQVTRLEQELRDSYDAEKRLTKALPKLAKAATASALQTALTSQLRETERQVTRLEQ